MVESPPMLDAGGSVHVVSYEIDPMLFNYLGDRMDGQAVSLDDLD